MRPQALIGLIALAASTSLAFRDTSPLLIWSSSPNEALQDASEAIESGVISAEDVYRTLGSLGCQWESMVIVHVDELHQSHLPSMILPSSSPANLHIPYLVRPDRSAIDNAIADWAQICGASVVTDGQEASDGKRITQLDATKADDILARLPPFDLLILTGSCSSPSPSIVKRQERPFPSHATSTSIPTSSRNATVPTDGPLLDRVQLLTTPIIMSLLITFGLFIPLISFGVYALAGIQVPPKMMEISKGLAVGKDRKDQ